MLIDLVETLNDSRKALKAMSPRYTTKNEVVRDAKGAAPKPPRSKKATASLKPTHRHRSRGAGGQPRRARARRTPGRTSRRAGRALQPAARSPLPPSERRKQVAAPGDRSGHRRARSRWCARATCRSWNTTTEDAQLGAAARGLRQGDRDAAHLRARDQRGGAAAVLVRQPGARRLHPARDVLHRAGRGDPRDHRHDGRAQARLGADRRERGRGGARGRGDAGRGARGPGRHRRVHPGHAADPQRRRRGGRLHHQAVQAGGAHRHRGRGDRRDRRPLGPARAQRRARGQPRR